MPKAPERLNGRCCNIPLVKRQGYYGPYYAEEGQYSVHRCEEYLQALRLGIYQIPHYWKDRIYASVTHWQNRDWTDCTRR